jgi:hypothetical protein
MYNGSTRELFGLIQDDLQKKYASLIIEGRSNDLAELVKRNDTPISVPEEVIQQGYRTCLDRWWLSDIKQLIDITGVKPEFTEATIQEKYKFFAKCGLDQQIKFLEKITGYKPLDEIEKILSKK